jgi:hypothetical protein
MLGEIISEWRARSNRNGGRDHSGMVGDIERNQQADADPARRLPIAQVPAPRYSFISRRPLGVQGVPQKRSQTVQRFLRGLQHRNVGREYAPHRPTSNAAAGRNL